jgi:hypothetical protein
MESRVENRKMTTKDDPFQIELTAITYNDKETNGQRQATRKDAEVQTDQIMGKDADIQTGLTGIVVTDYERNDRQNVLSKEVETESDSLPKFDGQHLHLDGEEPVNQKQVVIAVEDSGNIMDDSMTKNHRVADDAAEEHHYTISRMIHSIQTNPSPVMGYTAVPLLPLSKACAPLSEILHNLSFYVQLAMDETPEEPPDGLTIDESAAIRLYTIEWDRPHRSLYSMLNFNLKKANRGDLLPYFKYLKLFVTALVKLPCVPQLTVWRGVTQNLSADFPPGTRVTWWAFSSCTTEMTVLENNMYLGNQGSRTLFSVEAINGRTIKAHSHFVTEDELLLLPGTQMIVQSQLSPATDLHIIHLKQVIPDQILLEPPFEGI